MHYYSYSVCFQRVLWPSTSEIIFHTSVFSFYSSIHTHVTKVDWVPVTNMGSVRSMSKSIFSTMLLELLLSPIYWFAGFQSIVFRGHRPQTKGSLRLECERGTKSIFRKRRHLCWVLYELSDGQSKDLVVLWTKRTKLGKKRLCKSIRYICVNHSVWQCKERSSVQ